MKNFKIDQIAFLARTKGDVGPIKNRLGLGEAEWTEDIVTSKGFVAELPAENTAKLLFNEDTGIQIEIIQYLDGPNYTSGLRMGHVCHIGMHWDGSGDLPYFPAPVAQEVWTQVHTNQAVLDLGRHYHYKIYDTRALFGVHFKVIERL